MKFCTYVAGILLLCLACCWPITAKTLRAYHIGNSLTDDIYYGGLLRIAQRGDDTYTYGKDVSPGVPLDDTWEGQTKTGSVYSVPPYGTYSKALKNYTWDAMTLEPFDNEIAGSTGDLQIAEDFINLADKKSPNLQTYIYQRWPRRPEDAAGNFTAFDYTKTYTTPYTGSTQRFDLANERQGYFTTLVNDLNKALPKLKKSVKIIPVGDVMESLDKQIKAKKITDLSSITQLYSDDIHLDETGAYVIALTFYATMYDQNPEGQTVPGAYNQVGAKLASEIQDTVWNVVTTDPLDGVKAPVTKTLAMADMVPAGALDLSGLGQAVPEPTTLGLLAVLPLAFRRQKRGLAAAKYRR